MKPLFLDLRNRLVNLSCGTYKYAQTNPTGGLNDVTYSGTYANPSGLAVDQFIVTLATAGTPDKINFTNIDGTIIGTGISITACVPLYLGYGISVTFSANTGHTLNAIWVYNITSEPLLLFVQMWNNQLALQAKEGAKGADIYGFPLPAAFIEFVSPNKIEQLGNGNQLYEALIIKIHIAHEFLNATEDGSFMEEDLAIFDLRDKIYKCLQDFNPPTAKSVTFFRIAESQQYDHKNVYHYIQEYQTNYEDTQMNRPVAGVDKAGPTGSGITVTFNPSPGMK